MFNFFKTIGDHVDFALKLVLSIYLFGDNYTSLREMQLTVIEPHPLFQSSCCDIDLESMPACGIFHDAYRGRLAQRE